MKWSALLSLILVASCGAESGDPPVDDPRTWTHEKLMEGSNLIRPSGVSQTKILFVEGQWYQMGYQHGYLLADEIAEVRKSLDDSPIWAMVTDYILNYSPEGLDGRRSYAQHALINSLDFIVEECEGIVAGSEGRLTLEECAALNSIEYIFEDLFPRYLPIAMDFFNCTEFVAVGDATVDGKLIHGRNMDYWPIEGIMANPVILVRRPTDALRSVSIQWPAEVSTFTGMNEAGLAVGIDGNGCREEHRDIVGTPQLQLLTKILHEAHTVEQAEQIAKAADQTGCEMFLISHGPSRQAVTIEMSATTTAARGWTAPDVMLLTNHFLIPEMLDHQTQEDITDLQTSTVSRYARLLERLTGESIPPHSSLRSDAPDYSFGKIDVQVAIDILRDPVDMRPDQNRLRFPCTEHQVGNSIGSNNNVHSAVMLPEDMQFWLTAGWDAECKNPLYGAFVGYDAAELMNGNYDPEALPTYDPAYNDSFGTGVHTE